MQEFSLKVFVTFFTVIDPVGLAPFVIGMMGHYPRRQKTQIIFKAVMISGAVIAVFGVFGKFIFNSLGISMDAFSIAGGALLFLMAIDMLFGRPSGARETTREEEEALFRDDISVFPLAIPMIAGPGAIASVILLVSEANGNPMQLAAIAITGLITLLLAWFTMQISGYIQDRIGSTGIMVFSRILGMLLAALAVQFILNGIGSYVHGFLPH